MAYIDQRGQWTFGQLCERAEAFSLVLESLQVHPEERVLMCLLDSFDWPARITKEASAQAVAGDDNGGSWDSMAEFAGPKPKPATPLNAWEKYAQVLLLSNEFVFVE